MNRITFISSALIITGSIILASCGDDSPSVPETPSTAIPSLETKGKAALPRVRISDISASGKSIITCTYDNDGAADVITDTREHETYGITTGRYTTLTVDDGDYDDFKSYQNLTFNEAGYLTAATIVEGRGYKAHIIGRLTATYDTEGHITELTVNETDGSYETVLYGWEYGNMTSVTVTEADYRERETDVITYTYTDHPNVRGQYVYESGIATPAAITGWLGTPSAKLPETRTVKEHDKAPQKTAYTYTLNGDGTIATQKATYNDMRTVTYVYAY